MGRARWQLLAALALCLLLPLVLDQYKLYVLSLTLVYVILAIGLNLTLGYAGQISLAHAAFMAFGSYAVAILGPRGVPFEVGLVLGAAGQRMLDENLKAEELKLKARAAEGSAAPTAADEK